MKVILHTDKTGTRSHLRSSYSILPSLFIVKNDSFLCQESDICYNIHCAVFPEQPLNCCLPFLVILLFPLRKLNLLTSVLNVLQVGKIPDTEEQTV